MPEILACIFDLDGTLANVVHRLHHIKCVKPNWLAFFDACVNDTPNEYVVRLNNILYRNMQVFICSGRPDSHKDVTELWFKTYGVRYHRMWMRRAKDYRPDVIIKKEMLDEIRALNFNPVFAFDDRPDVVDMWRDNGVPCYVVDDKEWHE